MKSICVLVIAGALCVSNQPLFAMYKQKNHTVNTINHNKLKSNNAKNSTAKQFKKVSNQQKNWEQLQEKIKNKNSSMPMSFCTPQGRKNTYATNPVDSIAFLAVLNRLENTNTLR